MILASAYRDYSASLEFSNHDELLIWIFQMFIGFTSQRIVSPLVIILFLVKHQECRCMDFPILPTRLLQSLTIKKAESVQSILKVRIDHPYSYINVQIYSFPPRKLAYLQII